MLDTYDYMNIHFTLASKVAQMIIIVTKYSIETFYSNSDYL